MSVLDKLINIVTNVATFPTLKVAFIAGFVVGFIMGAVLL